jgi:DNA-binding MarR family transcriptional regulator
MLSSGGTSNLLKRLTDAGLIARDADPADARSSWVRLTEPGITVAEQAVRAATAAQAAALSTVPPETVRSAIDALRNVLLALGDRPAD